MAVNFTDSPSNGDTVTADGRTYTYDSTAGVWNITFVTGGNLTDVVEDTTPQLGGDLDVNGQSIVSASNGNIPITPDGTGKIVLDGLSWPTADGAADQVLATDGAGSLTFTDAFDGAYSSLTGTPTIPSALTDLGITDGTADQVLTTNGSGTFTFADASGGGGGSAGIDDNATSVALTINSAGDLFHGMTSAPTRSTSNYNPGTQLVSASTTGSAVIAFRNAETGTGDFCGAFLIGNNDTSGAEGHFCGMWAEAEADGKMDLFLSGERYKFENKDPHVTIDKDGNFYVHRQKADATNNTRAGVKIASSAIGETNGGQISMWCPTSDIQKFYNTSNSSALVGKITISTTSTTYATSSDYRLKENVVALTGATERLKQLNPLRFNFIADADTTVDGFLAHEVQSVVPEAITGTHNGVETWQEGEELPDGVSVGDNKLDENGNTIPEYQAIDQSKLVPLLVATIKELEARITQLENA